jgi:hypothetical protein
MAPLVYQITLTKQTYDALCRLHYVSSAMAFAFVNGYCPMDLRQPVYAEWSQLYNQVQPALYEAAHHPVPLTG